MAVYTLNVKYTTVDSPDVVQEKIFTKDESAITSSSLTWMTQDIKSYFKNDVGMTALKTVEMTGQCQGYLASLFEGFSKLESVIFDFEIVYYSNRGYDMYSCFEGCQLLSNFECRKVIKVTGIQRAFYQCKSLTSVDLSNIKSDLTNSFSMYMAFDSCSELLTVKLPEIIAPSVSCESAFLGCKKLESLVGDLHISAGPNKNSSSYVDFREVFRMCYVLKSIKIVLSGFTTIRQIWGAFESCRAVTSITIETDEPLKLEDTRYDTLFYETYALESVNIPDSILYSPKPRSFSKTFSYSNHPERYYDFSKITLSESTGTSLQYMFYCLQNADWDLIDLSNIDWSKVTDVSYMFQNSSITRFEIIGDFTLMTTSMQRMFYFAKELTYCDIRGLNIDNTQSMKDLFHGCEKLETIHMRSSDSGAINNISGMFGLCSALTNVSDGQLSLNTHYVTDMSNIFRNIKNGYIPLHITDFSSAKTISSMYSGVNCDSVIFENINFDECTDISFLFQNASITNVTLRNLTFSKLTKTGSAFEKLVCDNLLFENVTFGGLTQEGTSWFYEPSIKNITIRNVSFPNLEGYCTIGTYMTNLENIVIDGLYAPLVNIVKLFDSTGSNVKSVEGIGTISAPKATKITVCLNNYSGEVIIDGFEAENAEDVVLLYRSFPSKIVYRNVNLPKLKKFSTPPIVNTATECVFENVNIPNLEDLTKFATNTRCSELDLTSLDLRNIKTGDLSFYSTSLEKVYAHNISNDNLSDSVKNMFMINKSSESGKLITGGMGTLRRDLNNDKEGFRLDLHHQKGLFTSKLRHEITYNTEQPLPEDTWTFFFEEDYDYTLPELPTDKYQTFDGWMDQNGNIITYIETETTHNDLQLTPLITELYKKGVYATLWDSDDDGVGDLLLIGTHPREIDSLPEGITGTLITDYDNVDNNDVMKSGEYSLPTWSANKGDLKRIIIVDEIAPEYSMNSWFAETSKLTSIEGLDKIDTSNVELFSNLFFNSGKLTEIIIPDWNTSKVKTVSQAFRGCINCVTIDVNNWDTSNIEDFSFCFYSDDKLLTLRAENWSCNSAKSLYCLFYSCDLIVTINLPNFRSTQSKVNMSDFCAGCGSLENLIIPNFTPNPTDLTWAFRMCSKLKEVDVSRWNMSECTDLTETFAHCVELTTIDVSNWNTSKVSSMHGTFRSCSKIKNLDLSNWDVRNVTDMRYMFDNMKALETLDLSGWETPKLRQIDQIFNYTSKLSGVDFNRLNVSQVESFKNVFSECNQEVIDISSWDMSHGKNFLLMFEYCRAKTIKLGPPGTLQATNFNSTFKHCINLENLVGTEYINTSNVTNMSKMFYCCKLTELDLSSFDTSKVTDMSDMFVSLQQLRTIYVSPSFRTDLVPEASLMFNTNNELVGQAGTRYSEKLIQTKEMAEIDTWDNEGYFSTKEGILNQGDLSVTRITTNNKATGPDDQNTITFTPNASIELSSADGRFFLYGLQLYDEEESKWKLVYEKYSNQPLTLEDLTLNIRYASSNISDGDQMIYHYAEGLTSGEKYNYNLERTKTYRARIVTRIETETKQLDGISNELEFYVPDLVKFKFLNFCWSDEIRYENGYSVSSPYPTEIRIEKSEERLDKILISMTGDETQYEPSAITYTGQTDYDSYNVTYDKQTFKRYSNDDREIHTYKFSLKSYYATNKYSEGVVEPLYVKNASGWYSQFDWTVKNKVEFDGDTGIVKNLSLVNIGTAESTLLPGVIPVRLEISKDPDFNLLTHVQKYDLPTKDAVRGEHDSDLKQFFEDIQLSRSDVGMNYVRVIAELSKSTIFYSYKDLVSKVSSFEFILIDPEIEDFTITMNDNNQLVAHAVEVTGVPRSKITLEVYRDIEGEVFEEIPLTSGEDKILPYNEPGTAWYFKCRATNLSATTYAQTIDPESQEPIDKIYYKVIPLQVTPNYEEVAQPNITAQKIQLNKTAVLRFNWTNIETNAYRTQYNVYVITSNPISPSEFNDAKEGFSFQFQDREDEENVKFILECQLISSYGDIMQSYQIESPYVELDAVDLEEPSIAYQLDKTYHSITYNLVSLSKNYHKLAYELIVLSKNGEIISKHEDGDAVPSKSSPDLGGTTQILYDNLDASDSFDITYKYIFINPLDYKKQFVIEDTIPYNTDPLLLYPVKNESVDISHQAGNKATTDSNYHIRWTEPDKGSEPVQEYIVKYKKKTDDEWQEIHTSISSVDLFASELKLKNEETLQIQIGVSYTLYDGTVNVIWKSLVDIKLAVTDYVYYKSTYQETEIMYRKMFRLVDGQTNESLIRKIHSS